MNQNENLRLKVRMLKATTGISYKQLSNSIDIKYRSFLNWLGGQYELSYQKAYKLEQIVNKLKEN